MKALTPIEAKSINETFAKWQAPASEALDWLYRTGRITSQERNEMAFKCLQEIEKDKPEVRFAFRQEISVWDYTAEDVPKFDPSEITYLRICLFNKKR